MSRPGLQDHAFRWRMIELLAGGALMLLGLATVSGWALDIVALKSLTPDLPSTKVNAALLFTAAGVALVRNGVMRACAIFILAVALVTLVEHATGLDPGVDQLLFSDADGPSGQHPGRMTFVTAVGFLLVGAAQWLGPAATGSTRIATLARALTVGVLSLGLAGALARAWQFDLFYSSPVFESIAVYDVAGFVIAGMGLWACGELQWAGKQTVPDDVRLTRTAAAMLVIIAVGTGAAGATVLRKEIERSYGQGLQGVVEGRVAEIATNLALRTERARIVTTRSDLLRQMRILARDPGNGDALQAARALLDTFRMHEFSAISIASPGGVELARMGAPVTAPVLALRLQGPDRSELLWWNGIYLRNHLSLRDAEGEIGTVTAEQNLPVLTRMLLGAETAGGSSTEFQLCQAEPEEFRCFPTRFRPDPLILPRNAAGAPLPAQLARAEGLAGHGVARDHRWRRVLGAFSPVRDTGLIAVLNADARDVFRPLTRRLEMAGGLVLLLTAAGWWLMRRQVRPIAAALAESHNVVATAVDSIITIDSHGLIRSFNPGAERQFGWSAGEVIGRSVNLLMPMPHAAAHDGYIRRYLETGERRIIGIGREVTALRKDGTEFPVELAVGEFTHDGNRYFTGLIRDITARKEAERTARARLDELAQVIRRSSMNEFAAGFAHETSQPLTAMVTMAQALRRNLRAGRNDPVMVQETLDAIARQGERTGAIIQQMREFLRKGNTAAPSRHQPRRIIEGALELFEHEFRRLGIGVQHDFHDGPECVLVNRVQAEQVAFNVIQNAVLAMQEVDGDRTLTVATRLAGTAGALVEFSVSDTGIGLSQETDRIFEPYYTTREHGMGQGLSISRTIIESHGGTIRAQRNHDRGVTVIFTLPVVPAEHP